MTSKHGKVTKKLTVIHECNQSMNGCDRLHQLVSYYNSLSRKTVKWWKRVFTWVIEVCQANAYIIYCLTRPVPDPPTKKKKMTLKKFKEELIDGLCDKSYELDRAVQRDSDEVQVPSKKHKHLVRYTENDQNCAVCSGSGPAKRKRTKFVCTGCDSMPHLHPKECFESYHTKK